MINLKERYERFLKLSYGDIDMLIEDLNRSLTLFSKAKNQNNERLKERVELYTALIEYAENQRPVKVEVSPCGGKYVTCGNLSIDITDNPFGGKFVECMVSRGDTKEIVSKEDPRFKKLFIEASKH